jgi:hypothetical protein
MTAAAVAVGYLTIVAGFVALVTRAGRAVLIDIWNGLNAGLRALALGGRPIRAASRSPQVTRTPRDPRTSLSPDNTDNRPLLNTCPICGMDDPERFRLGVGVVKWHGWNAHDTCVEWLDAEGTPRPDDHRRPTTLAEQYEASMVYVPERQEPIGLVPMEEWGVWAGAGGRPYLSPGGRPVWPAGGMLIKGRLPGVAWTARLAPGDKTWPRIDMICMLDTAVLVPGMPSTQPVAAAQPSGSEVVALIYVPPGCTEIFDGLITPMTRPADTVDLPTREARR